MARDAAAIRRWLGGLYLFKDFDGEDLDWLARSAQWVHVEAGDIVFEQAQEAERLYLLVDGSVCLTAAAHSPPESSEDTPIRTARTPGFPVGWEAMLEPSVYRATAQAEVTSRLLRLEREPLLSYAGTRPRFGVRLMRRILWFVGDDLRILRMRLIVQRYEDETNSVRVMLAEHSPALRVDSPLHKLPHYLQSRLTLSDAFRLLETMTSEGDATERHLAELCSDLLTGVRREMQVYRHIQRVFEIVARAPANAHPDYIRDSCCAELIRLFTNTDHVIRGTENLPADSGHIFIMNHLANRIDSRLANGFVLTLDTHFVSSMVLYRHYGKAPMRVVRRSRRDEAGHQQYYDRLGYIYVPSRDSGRSDHETPDAEQLRRSFYERAAAPLRAGYNLVICPEGSNVPTEESPGPFRPGAFKLAAAMSPEPLLVPVVVANFDKRIARVRTAAVIHKPFRLSEMLPRGFRDAELLDFLNTTLAERYRRWVREAAELADAPG